MKILPAKNDINLYTKQVADILDILDISLVRRK
jgi:hypothetical protein